MVVQWWWCGGGGDGDGGSGEARARSLKQKAEGGHRLDPGGHEYREY